MVSNPSLAVLLLAALALPIAAQDPQPKKAARPAVYDEQADARQQITAALALAVRDHKRVLIQWGANWCGWCVKLHDTMKQEKALVEPLKDYQLVHVDVGRFDKHQDLVKQYGAEIKGIPFLTVLDASGKVLKNQPSDPLEEGDHHSIEMVGEFLAKWKPVLPDATELDVAARARAKAEDKMVFVHFGAPWCGWCHKLEGWMARPEIRAILELDFVDLKIDTERTIGAKPIQERYGMPEGSGIPWFAFVSGDGRKLADSTGEEGNVGFPYEPAEVAHFVKMLNATKKRISAEQVQTLEASLNAREKK